LYIKEKEMENRSEERINAGMQLHLAEQAVCEAAKADGIMTATIVERQKDGLPIDPYTIIASIATRHNLHEVRSERRIATSTLRNIKRSEALPRYRSPVGGF
jgi:hypothetical protein